MSNPGEADLTPITSTRQLSEWFAAGSKPKAAWRIGTEHEKFGFARAGFAPPPYEPGGIRAMLKGLQAEGWAPILDSGHVIGLKRDGGSVSLEPGGQFELSGAPMADLHETRVELAEHLRRVHAVGGPLGLGFAPLGFHPMATREDMPWMPKGRYAIMRRYMPQVGGMGLDMMLRTCTVQVNLDFGDEADMVEKLRVSLALQPLATALFANSPFREGKPSGFLTLRGRVWTDTDPDRTGIPPVAFEEGFGFARFAEFVLDVPMYFIMREGRYIDAAGVPFRAFVEGRAAKLAGHEATMGDWADHVTTVFTDVRLKRFLEMRGADAGSPAMLMAKPAFWTGLLYDDAAQKAAAALIRGWSVESMRALRNAVPAQALAATIEGRRLQDIARDAIAISRQGLRARGLGEEVYLAPLEEIAESGLTQAERWLQRYETSWAGDVRRIFAEAEA
ncbi:glutamate--cysteine ligase [Falsiroseomonas selenitidurans]|uniref:Glutamate--cysteine ligase n=1 Tax=Falsiroseomonas selenitidurans TaxID=2716335 RepID=A0ABX1DX13_9PROT|nr:glutamate--cysteine ligase [Falsiroseomonas selenitidurans]NKC29464.1 glutamate--cysteine ligase [Falsiroseomonas selenitidurans]